MRPCDHGRCTIPGCRASCFIDVHHLVPRAHGGTHEMSNLALLCAGHHRALHAGLIVIEGSAPDFRVIRVSEVPHVGDACSDEVHASGAREPIAVTANDDSASIEDAGQPEPLGDIDAEEVPLVGASRIDDSRRPDPRNDLGEVPRVGDLRRMAADVEARLVRLGFRRAEAHDAVARARTRGPSADAETLMRAALRECPRPTR